MTGSPVLSSYPNINFLLLTQFNFLIKIKDMEDPLMITNRHQRKT